MTHAEWDGREGPPEGMWRFARRERLAFLAFAAVVIAAAVVVAMLGVPSFGILGAVVLLPLAGARLAAEARARAADPDGVLADIGQPARLRLLHRGVEFGTDEGWAFVQNGLVCFHGRRVSFSVRPERLDEDDVVRYPVPGGEVSAALTFPRGGRARVIGTLKPPSPDAVEIFPPDRSGVRWAGETVAALVVVLLGTQLALTGWLNPYWSSLGFGIAVVLSGLGGLWWAWRSRRGR